MANKQSYSYKTRRNDVLITRMAVVFGLLLVAVFGLLKTRDWISTRSWLGPIGDYGVFFPVAWSLTAVFFIVTVFAAINFIKLRKTELDESLKVVTSSMLLTVSATLFLVLLTVSAFSYTGVEMSIAFVILVSLLYFISVCFPGSYFIMATFNAIGAFVLYAINPISVIDSPVLYGLLRALVFAFAIAFVVVVYIARSNNGSFLGIKILQPNADISPLLIAAVLFELFVVLGTFGIGSYILYDIIIALETIIFALFYAIKTLK